MEVSNESGNTSFKEREKEREGKKDHRSGYYLFNLRSVNLSFLILSIYHLSFCKIAWLSTLIFAITYRNLYVYPTYKYYITYYNDEKEWYRVRSYMRARVHRDILTFRPVFSLIFFFFRQFQAIIHPYRKCKGFQQRVITIDNFYQILWINLRSGKRISSSAYNRSYATRLVYAREKWKESRGR